ncbi:putative transcription factor kapC [Cyphellophora attinorum]|uniref:Putative transcription factor kapC n=1 Tax=Cyphellophora attinorum TaxID=1664694 RepID=A0A0N1P038_9EURO|nr:putative transcription factor kapC [Phialophora attinorum]KPI38552.1 putative transcription factor kapC [Phialophora attinorum]
MTSITQLLSPWPTVTKHSIVLREQYMPPAPPIQEYKDYSATMQQDSPTRQSNDPSSPPDQADNLSGNPDSDGGENGSDGRKGYGKRELSTSKRAAQNRAAQRAFRQRKEGYIKKLEEQVRDYQILSENFKQVQSENYQLRDYIINLQSRLLESQGEVPPPPSNVDGLQPGKAAPSHPGTLPRLSELGSVGNASNDNGTTQYADPALTRSAYPDPSFADRMRTSSAELTPSQAALQGPSVLANSPSSTRS